MTMKIIVACDESGAKGYADHDEQFPGQVGVFAGILVPEEALSAAVDRIEKAIAPYRGLNGKLHITDLEAKQQAQMRANIFAAILELKLPCFWHAIHVAGFYHWHQTIKQLQANSSKDLKNSNPNPRVKIGSPRDNAESLHAELFAGLYGQIVAFIEERRPGQVEIEVRTDKIDTPIAKLFRRKAEQLLDISPRTSTVTGFDTVTNKVVSAQSHFSVDIPPDLQLITEVVGLEITPVSDDDPIVVASDVLANSLCYHFQNRPVEMVYSDLNRPSAVESHPLISALDSFYNWGGPNMSDRLYRHPAAPPLDDN